MERILARSRQCADVKKDDGFAALHLAALNGHVAVAQSLLDQGACDINIRNNRKQTPLHLAVSQLHCPLVELLVSKGADVTAQDEEGENVLHVLVPKLPNIETHPDREAPKILEVNLKFVSDVLSVSLHFTTIVTYLYRHGMSRSGKRVKRRGVSSYGSIVRRAIWAKQSKPS